MILHIMRDDKFSEQFVELINSQFDNQRFVIFSPQKKLVYFNNSIPSNLDIVNYDIKSIMKLFFLCKKAKKIIIHGMFNKMMVYFLWLICVNVKCYWCVWGGDLYCYPQERGIWKNVKKRFVRKLAGIITPVKGDYLLVKEIYGTNAKFYDCLLYLSNVARIYNSENLNNSEIINVLIGHSADRGGCHKKIIQELINYSSENLRLILPMSYGDKLYREEIEKYINALITDTKIELIKEFMPREEYFKLLNSVNVAVFAFNRQQGVGNIVQLLSNGATVYLNPEVTTWDWLLDMGIKIKDINDLYENGLELITELEKNSNISIIRERTSQARLVEGWKYVLDV